MKAQSLIPKWVTGLAFSLLGSAGLWASGADTYQAKVSLVNNTGMMINVPGCSATDKDDNQCTVTGDAFVAPDATVQIGKAINKAHSAEGSFTLQAYGVPNLYKLTYKFDKHVSESSLVISASSPFSASEVIVNLTIDPSACTRNPDADGALRCCSYSKRHKNHVYWEYAYDCELPVTAGN